MLMFNIILFLYLVVLLLAAYVMFLADPDAPGLHGKASVWLLVTVPEKLSQLATRVFGEKMSKQLWNVYDYCVNQRNPILIITYEAILNSAFLAWLIYGYPMLPTKYVSEWTLYFGWIGVALCQFTFYKACTQPPGTITKETLPAFSHQPFDGLLYRPHNYCRTCQVEKPARSKHCSLCGICVPLFDHHCIWLNQCVGELNYRWFILFLIVNSAFFLYASYLVFLMAMNEVYVRNLFQASFINSRTRKEFKASYWMIAVYVLNTRMILALISLLALVMGIAVGAFLVYHCYLLFIGQTTNETFKWGSVKRVYTKMKKSYERFLAAKQQGNYVEKLPAENLTPADPSTSTPLDSIKEEEPAEEDDYVVLQAAGNEDTRENNKSQPDLVTNVSNPLVNDNMPIGCIPVGVHSIKEAEAQQHSVEPPASESMHPVRALIEGRKGIPRYLTEDPGTYPKNVYQIPFFDAVRRVIWPPSLSLLSKPKQD